MENEFKIPKPAMRNDREFHKIKGKQRIYHKLISQTSNLGYFQQLKNSKDKMNGDTEYLIALS